MGSDSQSLKLLCTLSFPGFLSLRFNIAIVFLQHLQQSSALRPSQVAQFQSCDFWPDLHTGMIQDIETYILYCHTLMPLLLKITKEKAYLIELFFLELHRSSPFRHYSIRSLLQITVTVASPCYNFWRQYPIRELQGVQQAKCERLSSKSFFLG